MDISKSDTLFCIVRRKWVKRTPEEAVRQAILQYLTSQLGYPISLMALEYAITVNERSLRCDIVVFSQNNHEPLLVIECKAGYVELTDKVLDQIVHYNLGLKVPHMLISNGEKHIFYSWDKQTKSIIKQTHILSYTELLTKS